MLKNDKIFKVGKINNENDALKYMSFYFGNIIGYELVKEAAAYLWTYKRYIMPVDIYIEFTSDQSNVNEFYIKDNMLYIGILY